MNQLKIGTIIKYITLVISNIIGIAYTPFLIRSLGPQEYGLYSLAISIVTYLCLLDFGLGAGTVRFASYYRGKNDLCKEQGVYSVSIQAYLIIGLLCFGFGMLIYNGVSHWYGVSLSREEIARLKNIILIIVTYLSVNFPLTVFTSIVTSNERFVFLQTMNLVKVVAKPILMTPLLILGYKAISLVVIIVIISFCKSIVTTIYVISKLKVKVRFFTFDKQLFKELVSFSLPIFGFMGFDVICRNFGQFYLGTVSGTVAVAIYSIGIQFRGYVESITKVVSTMLLPRYSSMVSQGVSSDEVSDEFIMVSRTQFHIATFIISCFILVGHPFILFWAGAEYSDAYSLSVILLLVLLIPMSESAGEEIMKAYKKHKYLMFSNIIKTVALISLTVILTHKYSYYGTAIALCISILLGDFILFNYYYEHKAHLNVMKLLRQLLGCMFFVVVLLFSFIILFQILRSYMNWVLVLIMYVALYIPLYFWICLNNVERTYIRALIKNNIKKSL